MRAFCFAKGCRQWCTVCKDPTQLKLATPFENKVLSHYTALQTAAAETMLNFGICFNF